MAGDTEKMLRKAAKQAAREILNEKKRANVAPEGAADKKPAEGTDKADWAQARAEEPENAEQIGREDPVEVQNRRIRKERNRLKKQFKGIDDRSRAMVEGLIEQAAFLRVQLQDLSDDIIENGVTELFSQGKDQEPYERRRPVADLYNSMNANYQKIIKQLNDLLPKPLKMEKGAGDGFIDFISGRDAF